MHVSRPGRETVFIVLIVKVIHECRCLLHQQLLFRIVQYLAILVFTHAVLVISCGVVI